MTRAVRQINITANRREDAAPRPFSVFSEDANVVLLGDPGAGKTHLFRETASIEQARFVTARAFLSTPTAMLCDPSSPSTEKPTRHPKDCEGAKRRNFDCPAHRLGNIV